MLFEVLMYLEHITGKKKDEPSDKGYPRQHQCAKTPEDKHFDELSRRKEEASPIYPCLV
jgi:hypothetical protein